MHGVIAVAAELLVVAGAAWVGWLYFRGGAGTALSGLQHANRELVRQVHELQRRVDKLEVENAQLRAETNVAEAITPVVQAVKLHEQSAARRADALLTVLNMMAERLGRDEGS